LSRRLNIAKPEFVHQAGHHDLTAITRSVRVLISASSVHARQPGGIVTWPFSGTVAASMRRFGS
jgi:hypothetical protein